MQRTLDLSERVRNQNWDEMIEAYLTEDDYFPEILH